MDSPVHDHVVEMVRSIHPEIASTLTPAQWQQIIQAVIAIVTTIIGILNPPVPTPPK